MANIDINNFCVGCDKIHKVLHPLTVQMDDFTNHSFKLCGGCLDNFRMGDDVVCIYLGDAQ